MVTLDFSAQDWNRQPETESPTVEETDGSESDDESDIARATSARPSSGTRWEALTYRNAGHSEEAFRPVSN